MDHNNERAPMVPHSYSRIEWITPERAKEYLKRNTRNRPLNRRTVTAYAKAMRAGEWMQNGDSIVFDWDEVLINGQHRLTAVVEAGVPVQMLVLSRVDPASFATYDCGRLRKAGDTFAVSGIPDAIAAAAISAKVLRLRRLGRALDKGGNQDDVVTRTGLLDEYNRDSAAIVKALSLAGWARRKPQLGLLLPSRTGAIAVYLHVDMGYAWEIVERFFKELESIMVSECNSINLLRNRLLDHRRRRETLAPHALECLVVKAWNDYASGKNDVKALKCNESPAFRPAALDQL